MNSATSSVTIDKMRSTFASHGLPSINGLVEQAVQTFKQGMKKQGDGSVDRTHHNGNTG